MLETALAQMRFAASLVFGMRFSPRSLEQLVASLRATQHEFGTIGSEGATLLGGPTLDEETRRAMQLRRLRTQAVPAACGALEEAVAGGRAVAEPHPMRGARGAVHPPDAPPERGGEHAGG